MVSAFEKIILLVAAGGPAGGGEASKNRFAFPQFHAITLAASGGC